jgi:benzodiazapine receptor
MDAPLWTILPFLGLAFLASITGAVFKPGVWYEKLDKPGWTPPDWLFPVAWLVLYIMMAVAAWRIWDFAGIGIPLYVWGIQLVLNAGWSAVFFGLRSPMLCLFEVFALWLAVAATIFTFATVDMFSAALLIPYLVWVSFAAALNLSIVRRRLGAVA